MKLSIVILLAIVTVVTCSTSLSSVQFRKIVSGKGENCICREKQCTDVSCEEKNCICVVKALKSLQNNCSKYSKKWVDNYLKLSQERCLCIQGCQKICSPDEFIKCSSSAYDRFLCKYLDWFEGIVHEKGSDEFVEDIRALSAECINKDCKPICTGSGDCDPLSYTPKSCSSTKACIWKVVQSLSELLNDPYVQEALSEYSVYAGAYYDQKQNCLHLPLKSQALCNISANEESNRALENLFNNLVSISGPCTAISIMSSLKQGILDCTLKN